MMNVKVLLGVVCALLPLAHGGHTFHGFNVGRAYAVPASKAATVKGPRHAPAHIIPEGPHCTTEYVTVPTTVCKEVPDRVCSQEIKTKYHTEYVEECSEVYKKECYPTTRPVKDKKCDTVYEEVCTKNTEKTYETTYKEECHDVVEQICEPAPAAAAVAAVPAIHAIPAAYGYARGGYAYPHRRYGRSTGYGYKPVCHEVKKPVCTKVPINSPKYVVVPNCSKVPRTKCQDIVRDVPDTKCQDVPERKCAKVPKQVAHDVPVEKCETVPKEKCHQVPKKVPKEVCKQYKH